MTNSFYSYAYLDPSKPGRYTSSLISFLFRPLYIGKGKKERFIHGIEALSKSKPLLTNRRLYCKLKNLLKKGYDPLVIKLQTNLTSEEALNLEGILIEEFGRLKYDSNGILLNICRKGDIWDSTGVPPPSKGKKMTDFLTPEKYKLHIEAISKPKSESQKIKMVKTRRENNTYYTAEKHPMAKHWQIISNDGEIFEVNGSLKNFCELKNLSWQTLYNNKDNGPIILDRSKYKNIKRLSEKFFNTIGWEMKSTF